MQQKRKALKAMQRKFAALQERLKNELAALDTTEARVRHLDGLRKVGSASSMRRHESGAAPAVTAICNRAALHVPPCERTMTVGSAMRLSFLLETQWLAVPGYCICRG